MRKHISLSVRQLLCACCLFVAFLTLTCFLFSYHRDEKQFQRLCAQLFAQEMLSSTLNMHYTLAYPSHFGISDYEAKLPLYSADGQLNGQASTENMLAALHKLSPTSLSAQDAYTYTLLVRSLENSLRKSSYPYYEEPLSPSSGMQSQLPILLAEYTFRTRQDVTDYLALLDQTDEYFASLLTFEQQKAAAGLLMPAVSLQSVRRQCDTIVSKKELEGGAHFLQTTFQERLQTLVEKGEIDASEVPALLAQNDRLLKTVMQPAYEALSDGLFLLEDDTISLSGLGQKPLGREYYRYLLISETGSYRKIEDIRTLLTSRFQEEYSAIRKLASHNPALSTQLALEEYTTLPCGTPAEMLRDLQARMNGTFPSLPDADSLPLVAVKAVSDNLEAYCAPAFYLTTPIDDTENNVIYINCQNPPSGLSLYTTLAHEGYPGHLYQTVYANRTFLQNRENNVRQLLWYGGYLEGWALYVEFQAFDYASALLSEQNRQTDALCVQIEKHNRSLQLCLYSLLDIMIHYEGASLEQITPLLNSLGITKPDSVQAVYTYIVQEPCNYLKYYLGYLEILELQKLARTQWGDSYTDLDFHTFYLDCGPSDFTSLTERLQGSSYFIPLACSLNNLCPIIKFSASLQPPLREL